MNSKVYGRASKPMRKDPGMPELKACREGIPFLDINRRAISNHNLYYTKRIVSLIDYNYILCYTKSNTTDCTREGKS